MKSLSPSVRCNGLRFLFALLVGCIIHPGCSSNNLVTYGPGTGESTHSFNVSAKDERATLEFSSATLEFHDGRKVEAHEVKAAPDSTLFIDMTNGATRVVPTHDIVKIVSKDRFIGYLEGLGLGLLAGVVTGVLVSVIARNNDAIVGAGLIVVGATAGGLIGGILGIIFGHTYEYTFGD